VTAIFGTPVAHDDDAQRAARDALAIQAAIPEVSARRPSGQPDRVALDRRCNDGRRLGILVALPGIEAVFDGLRG
jgi:hypothetical protein